ncbi:MAG: MupA/Atu3671 family FMN-dependent luciferase-like monooxygenase [Lysobacterales bacterium]
MNGHSFSCLLVGGQSLLVQCAQELRSRGHTISAIISNESDVASAAKEMGIPVLANGPSLGEELAGIETDYLFSIVNLSISPDFLIKKPRIAAINFHDGLLPDFAGLNVPSWALLSGAAEHGVTWHEMTSEVDQGRVYVQARFSIAEGQSAFALNAQCFEQGFKSFQDLLGGLESQTLQPQPQADRPGQYFARSDRPEDMGLVNWANDAAQIVRGINALDFGGFADNPLTAPKTLHGDQVLLLSAALDSGTASAQAPGTMRTEAEGIRVSSATNDVLIQGVRGLDGQPLSHDLTGPLSGLDLFNPALLESMRGQGKSESAWVKRLSNLRPLDLAWLQPPSSGEAQRTPQWQAIAWEGANLLEPAEHWAVQCAFFARLANVNVVDLAFELESRNDAEEQLPVSLYGTTVPLRLRFDPADSLADLTDAVSREREKVARRGAFAKDVFARYRALQGQGDCWLSDSHPVTFSTSAPTQSESSLVIACNSDGTVTWHVNTQLVSQSEVARLHQRLDAFAHDLKNHQTVGNATLLDHKDKAQIADWNSTAVNLPATECIHHQIERQVERTPNATATRDGFQTLSYRQLNDQANRLAHWLIAQGVGPDDRIGIYLPRSSTIQVVMLAILKSGAAYIPLDPEYPSNRVAHVVEDSGMRFAITQGLSLAPCADRLIDLNTLKTDLATQSIANPTVSMAPTNLAYAIYTSGSTGLPKGVLVEHRQVVNFFAGMDQRLEPQEGGVWLAVTSMSFDISVLELLWTLARGYNVLVHGGQPATTESQGSSVEQLKLSLFFWNHVNEADLDDPEKYRLLMDAVKFADTKGFHAVWTPERHFGAFGGSYPNPAVVSAAIAAVTENLQIRAGSVVAPLHSPIRIAEDWSVVDNLSGGRVGVSFAAGWQPNDFVIRPQGFDNAKQQMLDAIDTVQALWRGETLDLEGPKGPVSVKTLPRPIQPALPVWLTTAGNPESFKAAGKKGVNLLTHLLGQTVEGVAENIALYRQAWRDAGHNGNGHVTLMLHTLVGEAGDTSIKEKAREPMKSYLKSAMFLVKDAAWEFPTFKKMSEEGDRKFDDIFAELAKEDLDALLDFAFERYYEQSGLFGTPQRCMETLQTLSDIGIDEVGCLIDFGLDNKQVMEHLPALASLNEQLADLTHNTQAVPLKALSDQVLEQGVSHLQCTPSQAVVLAAEPNANDALQQLQHLMVGGEALPRSLAQQLKTRCAGRVTNMYGPTETTIWSSTWEVPDRADEVLIGEPIANTWMQVFDEHMQPLPPGSVGELVIGGEGVVRGYHGRDELTAERFVQGNEEQGRFYRTGDQARFVDGRLECLGRSDHQVKIRGYRIELGEIEAVAEQRDDVTQCVVVMREDRDNDQQLVAYVLGAGGQDVPATELRAHLLQHLPDFMVPAAYVKVTSFPTTPNGKIDRKALKPPAARRAATQDLVAPESDLEERIGKVWVALLETQQIGVNDNFFEIGGHSLLAVKMQAELTSALGQSVSIIDIFQYPTIRLLAGNLGASGGKPASAAGSSRASRRKAARPRR